MYKRGTTLVLKPIFEILLAVTLVVSFLGAAKALGTQDYFVNFRTVEDLALLVDASQSVSGNFWINYPMVGKEVHLEKTAVAILDNPPFRHAFPGAVGITPAKSTGTIIFYKNGNKVSFAEKEPNTPELACSGIELDYFSVIKMTVTPETQSIAHALLLDCNAGVCTKGESKGLNEDLSIKTVPLERNGVVVRFYYDSLQLKESKEFACRFINKLRAYQPGLDVWLLPSDDSTLPKDAVALLIEFNPNYLGHVGDALRDAVATAGVVA